MSKTIKRVTTLFVALAMSVGLCFGLAACGGGGAASEEDQIKAELDKVLSALQNPTEESLSAILGDDTSSLDQIKEMGVDPYELLKHLFSKFEYSIDSVVVNGDTADAQVTMSNVDIQTVLTEAMEDLQSDEAFVSKVTEAYLSDDLTQVYPLIFDKMYEAIDASDKVVTSTVNFKLAKEDGQWNIDDDSMKELVSGMYGGLDLDSLS